MNPDIADTFATLIESLQSLAAALRKAFPKPPADDVEPEKPADDAR